MPFDLATLTKAIDDLPRWFDEPVPELGGDIRFTRLTATEAVAAAEFINSLSVGGRVIDPEAQKQVRVDMICRAAIDEAGNRFLDDASGREIVGKLPQGTLIRLHNRVSSINGLGAVVEEAKKN